MTFNNLDSAFSKVHNSISRTKPIQPSSIPEMQTAIDNYMLTYRRMFPLKSYSNAAHTRETQHPTQTAIQDRAVKGAGHRKQSLDDFINRKT